MIKFPPKGKRWGDVIRRELADPHSRLSETVREFKAWIRLAKTNKYIKLEVDYCGYICVRQRDDVTHISGMTDVSYLFMDSIPIRLR